MTIQNRQHQSFSHIRSYSFFSEFELLLELNSILSCGKGAVFARDSTALLGQRQHPSQSTLFPVPPSPLRRRRQSLSGPQERKEKKSALKSHFFLCVSNMWGMGRSGALLRLIGPIDSGSRFDGGMPLPPLLLFSDEEVELRDESEERELAGFTLAFSHRFPKRRRRNHFFFVIARPFYKGGAHPRSKQKGGVEPPLFEYYNLKNLFYFLFFLPARAAKLVACARGAILSFNSFLILARDTAARSHFESAVWAKNCFSASRFFHFPVSRERNRADFPFMAKLDLKAGI